MQDIIRVEDTERLAYTKTRAAKILGIGRTKLYELIRAGEIVPLLSIGNIARSELVRFSHEQTLAKQRKAELALKAEQARKPKRVPRSQYKPINQPLPCQP